jgi:hypothetical protein
MPGFLDRFRHRSDDDPLIWTCEPLVVVHAEDGAVFAKNVDVEYRPDDTTGNTGNVKVLGAGRDGWSPQLRYHHRMNTIQGLDPRLQKRPGIILMGEDETGESFTWYINGEADRYLTRPPEAPSEFDYDPQEIARILETSVDRDQAEVQDVRLLHIVREDGWCPVSGPSQIRVCPAYGPPVLEHLTSMTSGDDATWPELFVLSREWTGSGWRVKGIDANGIATTWYLDGAAEDYLSKLP